MAASVSDTVRTRTRSIPSQAGDEAGTMARVKPIRMASPSRRLACDTWRTSPPRPISPITISRR